MSSSGTDRECLTSYREAAGEHKTIFVVLTSASNYCSGMAARAQRRAIARETVQLLESSLREGNDLGDALRRAIDNTVTYPPEVDLRLHVTPSSGRVTEYEVGNEGTLTAARRLARTGFPNPAVLNFASAKNPGGGFLGGSQAQEESLSRCSGLYFCIKDGEMYKRNRGELRDKECVYSHYMMYSPEVPVFREDTNDDLLSEGDRYVVSFITAPAVNAGVARKRGVSRDVIASKMRERMERVLAVAALHAHEALVLGAFGCGVFGNEPAVVAALFRELLEGPFAGRFRKVVFAVLDNREETKLRAFQGAFRMTPSPHPTDAPLCPGEGSKDADGEKCTTSTGDPSAEGKRSAEEPGFRQGRNAADGAE